MAVKRHVCLLGLIILCSQLTGVTAVTHVFRSSGENVALPCINALSNCTSTTWNYNNHSSSAAVELIHGGIKKNNTERAERLSLGSDCSLNIYKTTEDDHGQYTCRQYVNRQQHGNDAQIFLHVLYFSPSSTQTEMRSGSSVTLTCQLFLYEDFCKRFIHSEDLQLFWVNQADVNLLSDSRYQIVSPGPCIITLTTILLNEDNNTEWRCLVKMKNEIKTSVSYTVRFTASATATNSKITSSPPASLPPDGGGTGGSDSKIDQQPDKVTVIVPVIAVVVFLFAVVLLLAIWKKRANRRKSNNSVVTDKDDNNGNNDTIDISIPLDEKDDVTYSDVITSSKTLAIKNNVPSADNVTYAALR
ncbi:uncharacterized protein [Paramisgurnus dabryanus]|uniref:uncharacterized protein n=1 Tax=Paramisgurnus dabryanus TaxID=90735 RepID=UPI0031F39773